MAIENCIQIENGKEIGGAAFPASADRVSYRSETVADVLDRADTQLIHTAAANQTFAAQMAELDTAYLGLSDAKKQRAYILFGENIKFDINQIISRVFASNLSNGTSLVFYNLTLVNKTSGYLTVAPSATPTYTDTTNTINTQTLSLYA